jgi:hypothetical protein
LQQQLHDVRLQEQQEALAQQQVELHASQGLDGPRPCLCSNGLEQVARVSRCKAAMTARSTSGGGGTRSPVVGSSIGGTRTGGRTWKGVHEA